LNIPLFRVDAFASKLFEGNPAAVCPLQDWRPDETLRAVAAENNLSETAFFVPQGDHYALRWFTPRCEVNLCGHATLAAAHIILKVLSFGKPEIRFETRSGPLQVHQEGEMLAMDFPSLPPWQCDQPPAELLKGLGAAPERVLQIKDNYFAVFRDEEQILELRPNLVLLAKLHPAGVCVTAPGKQADFVSRYFVPSYGIPEDPVTGSSHCSLTPYWAGRLGKQRLHARQLSARGGELWCEQAAERVILKGRAILYLTGSLTV
jgi:PhzF family phenazine biosynthesis protein